MLQGEHSAILSTFIKLPFVIKIFALSIFQWPFYTSFTVLLISSLPVLTKHKRWEMLDFCPENVVCFFTSAAYILMHFRLEPYILK